MRTKFLLATAALLLSAAATANSQTTAGNAENGKRLFTKEGCYFCHGTVGQGGRDGARIGATALNLQGFTRYVRAPAGAMPAFTDKLLSDQQLADIYAYLKSLPAAKAPKDIPILDQMRDK